MIFYFWSELYDFLHCNILHNHSSRQKYITKNLCYCTDNVLLSKLIIGQFTPILKLTTQNRCTFVKRRIIQVYLLEWCILYNIMQYKVVSSSNFDLGWMWFLPFYLFFGKLLRNDFPLLKKYHIPIVSCIVKKSYDKNNKIV